MRDGGYFICTDANGSVEESSSFTCEHCNKVVLVKSKANLDDLGGMCRSCMKMICPACVGRGCFPFEKKLEIMEARFQSRRSMGLA